MENHASPTHPRTPTSLDTCLPHLHIVTDDFANWRQTADLLFNPVADAGSAFVASLKVFHFQRFLLCSGRLAAARYERDRSRLAWCDLDHYLLHLPLQHGLACANGLRVRPGDVVALDLSQPATFGMTAGEGLSLVVPRTAFGQEPPLLHGLRLRRDSAVGHLLAGLLTSLAVAATQLSQAQAVQLGSPLLRVVAACLLSEGTQQQAVVPFSQGALGRRARQYIELNLHRDDLTPAHLAKAVGTSRSQLYRAFAPFGGVGHYLLQRRLRRCLLALGEPGNAGRRIGDLAYAHGFVDEGHFSKVFRKAFGLSPRAARRALQRGELTGLRLSASEPPSLARWLHALADQ